MENKTSVPFSKCIGPFSYFLLFGWKTIMSQDRTRIQLKGKGVSSTFGRHNSKRKACLHIIVRMILT
jgi:hypothetical protein